MLGGDDDAAVGHRGPAAQSAASVEVDAVHPIWSNFEGFTNPSYV